MRKLAATLIPIFCVSLFLLAQSPNDKDLLEKAKALYKKKDYVGSAQTLERIEPRTAEVIYWLWKNEGEIGWRAGIGEQLGETDRRYKYYLYVKDHPEYFDRNEASGVDFSPTRKRLDKLESLFPHSEYAGSIRFELLHDYDDPMLSDGGLDEGGRVYLISQYQEFVNQHPYVSKAQEQIEHLVRSPQKQLERFGYVMANESMLMRYGRRFQIDEDKYRKYIDEWLKSGPYREFGIEVFAGRRGPMKKGIFNRFDISKNIKLGFQSLLENGRLVLFSEAAYKNEDWQGPKALVFDPKAN